MSRAHKLTVEFPAVVLYNRPDRVKSMAAAQTLFKAKLQIRRNKMMAIQVQDTHLKIF